MNAKKCFQKYEREKEERKNSFFYKKESGIISYAKEKIFQSLIDWQNIYFDILSKDYLYLCCPQNLYFGMDF